MTDDPTNHDSKDDVGADERSDRIHRATIEFGLAAHQAERFETLVAAATPDGRVDLDAAVGALDETAVAEAAWTRWGDLDLLGAPIATLVSDLAGRARDVAAAGGFAWLSARHAVHDGRLDDAIALLEAARSSGHPLVLCELAGIAADRSEPLAARELLVAAGVDVDIDLDSEFDPLAAGTAYGDELAEEIAPFAAIRPKAMAGRNDRCPCGSGKKYKQCHLGRELHPMDERSGWVYVKLMRFMQTHEPTLATVIADDLVEHVVAEEIIDMVRTSYLPVDLALFEGGVAQRFLDTKRSVLPSDEIALLESWISSTRSVFEVARSRPGTMELVDMGTRERFTVIDTVPDEPLDAGWLVAARLTSVGDTHRNYGGFLPVNEDMVPGMLAGFGTGSLETTVLSIGQIFDTATTHDEMGDAFGDALDTTELRDMIEGLGDQLDPEQLASLRTELDQLGVSNDSATDADNDD